MWGHCENRMHTGKIYSAHHAHAKPFRQGRGTCRSFNDTVSLRQTGQLRDKRNSRHMPGILLERAIRRGSLPLAKEAPLAGYPPSFAMAALAAICSAAPKSSAFRGTPFLSILGRAEPALRQENSRHMPGILLERAIRRGSLPLAKEAPLAGYPPSFAMAALAAICSASFLLWPLPEPTGSPFRSTSTKKRLSWSGPSSPVRRYFSTWPLSRWTSS